MRLAIAVALGIALGFAAPLYAADSHEAAEAPESETPADVSTPPAPADEMAPAPADEMAPAEGEEEPSEGGSDEEEADSKPE